MDRFVKNEHSHLAILAPSVFLPLLGHFVAQFSLYRKNITLSDLQWGWNKAFKYLTRTLCLAFLVLWWVSPHWRLGFSVWDVPAPTFLTAEVHTLWSFTVSLLWSWPIYLSFSLIPVKPSAASRIFYMPSTFIWQFFWYPIPHWVLQPICFSYWPIGFLLDPCRLLLCLTLVDSLTLLT